MSNPRHAARSGAQPKSPLIAALVKARLAQGLTLAELSKRTGYHICSLVHWENEHQSPKMQSVIDWAQALNLKIVLQPAE